MALDTNQIEGGGKAFSFENVGDKVQGEIKLVEERQQRSFDGGEPLTWDDGSPRMIVYIELDTDLRDDDSDDGVRTLYLKGGNFEVMDGSGKSGRSALALAAREAGAKTIEEGGNLVVKFSGRGKPSTRGYQPSKLFEMAYAPPTTSVSTDDLWG